MQMRMQDETCSRRLAYRLWEGPLVRCDMIEKIAELGLPAMTVSLQQNKIGISACWKISPASIPSLRQKCSLTGAPWMKGDLTSA